MEPPGLPTRAVPAVRQRRPVAVTLVAVLTLVVGAYGIGHGVLALVRGGSASLLSEGGFDLVLSAVGIAIGVAALRMRRWSWVALMSWALVGLVHQLLRRFFYDNPDYLS